MDSLAQDVFEESMFGSLVEEFAARASSESLALLLAIGSVASSRLGKEASTAAARLVAAGVPTPAWAAELGEPVTVGDYWCLSDSQGAESMLACTFHRAGRSHAVVVRVDHDDCSAASEILLLDADGLPEMLARMRTAVIDDGREVVEESLDPAEFRWRVENALDARAVHDGCTPEYDMADMAVGDGSGPAYPALAMLVRARMNALPLAGKPPAPHKGDLVPLPRLARMLALP
jgi:hypothetical protein